MVLRRCKKHLHYGKKCLLGRIRRSQIGAKNVFSLHGSQILPVLLFWRDAGVKEIYVKKIANTVKIWLRDVFS